MDINNEITKLNWNKEPQGLYEPIAYALQTGGKRLRPQLALIAAQIFDGNEQDVLPAALALELFHNFTLLHDDVMDKADMRRGRPTVHIKWNENTAILSGDQMLIEAYKLLEQVPTHTLPQVLHMFNKMATEICEGQQYDIDFENNSQTTINDYLMMIERKTSVLLATALRIGAYIAGANTQQQQALYQYGIHIGLAFQIQDDILDVYSDPKTFGKAIGGDIACNKTTYLLLTALQLADTWDKHELQQWLNNNDAPKDEKITAVTALYNRIGVRPVCEKAVQTYTQQAVQDLQTLPQNKGTQALQTLAESLYSRTK